MPPLLPPQPRPEPPFFRRCREDNNRPFLDEQPMVGSPDRSWSRFRRPLLRKCPFEGDIEFGRQLGFGIDGIVWKVRIDGRIFALKVFWDNAIPGGRYYYAIQRECHNAALLEMIQSAVQESNEPIYLNPDPKTFKDAIYNLQAFCDERREKQKFKDMPGAAQVTSTPRIRQCFGWTKVNESQLKGAPVHKFGKNYWRMLRPNEDYFAIVYEYVPERPQRALATAADIQPQLDFFRLVGFCFVPEMRTAEWHTFGLFMDMCDLVNVWCAEWSEWHYRRFVVGQDKFVNRNDIPSTDDDDDDDSNDGNDGHDGNKNADGNDSTGDDGKGGDDGHDGEFGDGGDGGNDGKYSTDNDRQYRQY